jgi:polysaccharide biosynthesis protein PslH
MRVLWVVTKPPWPPIDGGRVLVANTLQALAAQGHELTLVSPFDPARADREELDRNLRQFCDPQLVAASPRSLARAFLRSRCNGIPLAVSRHSLPAVKHEVARSLSRARFQVVHAEQLQALPQCEPAARQAVPIVLRAQNVESDLWSGLDRVGRLLRPLVGHESGRLARYEACAVRTVAATVALTARDAHRLRDLTAAKGTIHHVPTPFPEWLPPGPQPLSGAPAVVVLAGDWWPNREGATAFVSRMWPVVRTQIPTAVLHLFGTTAPSSLPGGVILHRPPADSSTAFPPGAILVAPLRVASGVRIKILEAWARGLPVVATSEAAAGLEAQDGRELVIANDGPGFAAAIRRLHQDPAFVEASIEAGRALLRGHHDPRRVAQRLAEVYAGVIGSSRKPQPRPA